MADDSAYHPRWRDARLTPCPHAACTVTLIDRLLHRAEIIDIDEGLVSAEHDGAWTVVAAGGEVIIATNPLIGRTDIFGDAVHLAAVQAVRDYRRSRRSVDDLFEAARVCRVERTLRTYLEAMT